MKQIHLSFEILEISVFINVQGFYLTSERWPASFNLLLAISLTSFTSRQGAKHLLILKMMETGVLKLSIIVTIIIIPFVIFLLLLL